MIGPIDKKESIYILEPGEKRVFNILIREISLGEVKAEYLIYFQGKKLIDGFKLVQNRDAPALVSERFLRAQWLETVKEMLEKGVKIHDWTY